MKTRLTTALLVASFVALTPSSIQADDQPNEPDNPVVAGCVVIAVGIVVYWGLSKLCDKVLPPTTKPVTPPPVVPPPIIQTNSVPTNCPTCPKKKLMGVLNTDQGVTMANIAAFAFPDVQASNTVNFTTMFATVVESSRDMTTWKPECTITGYLSSAGSLVAYYTNGVLAMTTYAPNRVGLHQSDLDMTGGAGSKLFRLRQP